MPHACEVEGSHRSGSTQKAGWYPDPTGSHRLRYWRGDAWLDVVSDADDVSRDLRDAVEAIRNTPEGMPESWQPTQRSPRRLLTWLWVIGGVATVLFGLAGLAFGQVLSAGWDFFSAIVTLGLISLLFATLIIVQVFDSSGPRPPRDRDLRP
jgi:hypothetical protein